jgi:hypothetical protein
MKKVGDIVQTWFDTGAMGSNILFGRVVQAGPKAFLVVWESGLRNRLKQDHPIDLVEEDLKAIAEKALKRVGV